MSFTVVEKWAAVVVVFSSLFLAIFCEVGGLMVRLSGQHVVAAGPFIFTGGLYNDIEAMQEVQSISQFATETVVGLVSVLVMTLGAAAILLGISLTPGRRPKIWANLAGYAVVVAVGIFPTTVPGAPPRRSYNPVLLWPVADSATGPIHLTAAALFLYLPAVSTVVWLVRNRKGWRWKRWLALYAFVLVLSVGYGVADLAVDSNTTLSPGAWLLLELTAFGCSFAAFAFFELVRLSDDIGRSGYHAVS